MNFTTNTEMGTGPRMEGLRTEVHEFVNLRNHRFERLLEGIIQDLLERKGVIYSFFGERVALPKGELVGECDGTQCHYSTGFEVYDCVGRRVLFGRAAGTMVPRTEDTYEIHNLEIYSLHHY
jgi:hypothetical protein